MDIGKEEKVHEVKPRQVPFKGDEVKRKKGSPKRKTPKKAPSTPKKEKEKVGA